MERAKSAGSLGPHLVVLDVLVDELWSLEVGDQKGHFRGNQFLRKVVHLNRLGV
jgi:hypothetical protein